MGAWLRRGSFHSLSRQTITSTGIGVFGMDAVVGSLFVGGVLAVLAGTGTYVLVRGSGRDPMFADLVRRTSDRYLGGSITAWEFARGKLRMDPVYRATLSPDLLPPGGTLLDIGCGQGLTLALLVEARRAFIEHRWPASSPEPPRFDRMVGIETRPRPAASAQGSARRRCRGRSRRPENPHARTGSRGAAVRRPSPSSVGRTGGAARRPRRAARPGGRRPDPRNRSGGRLAVHGGSRRQRLEGSRVQDPEDSGVQSAHAGRMARLLCAPRIPQRDAADGRRDAVRQRAVPPHPGGRRVWTRRPTFTSCVSARPLRSKTPPAHTTHDTRSGVDAGPQ